MQILLSHCHEKMLCYQCLCFTMSEFVSLVNVFVGIVSSAVGIKVCAIKTIQISTHNTDQSFAQFD